MADELYSAAELDARDFSQHRESRRSLALESQEPIPALAHRRGAATDMAAEENVEWVPDPRVYCTSAGTEVIHLHQHYHGVPVFEAMRTVHRDAEGVLRQVTGESVRLPEGLKVEPEFGAPDALLAASRHLVENVPELALEITGYRPRVLAAHALPAEPTVLHKRPFDGPVLAHLTLFDLGAEVRLGWYLSARLPAFSGSWDFIVQAHGEEAGRV